MLSGLPHCRHCQIQNRYRPLIFYFYFVCQGEAEWLLFAQTGREGALKISSFVCELLSFYQKWNFLYLIRLFLHWKWHPCVWRISFCICNGTPCIWNGNHRFEMALSAHTQSDNQQQAVRVLVSLPLLQKANRSWTTGRDTASDLHFLHSVNPAPSLAIWPCPWHPAKISVCPSIRHLTIGQAASWFTSRLLNLGNYESCEIPLHQPNRVVSSCLHDLILTTPEKHESQYSSKPLDQCSYPILCILLISHFLKHSLRCERRVLDCTWTCFHDALPEYRWITTLYSPKTLSPVSDVNANSHSHVHRSEGLLASPGGGARE